MKAHGLIELLGTDCMDGGGVVDMLAVSRSRIHSGVNLEADAFDEYPSNLVRIRCERRMAHTSAEWARMPQPSRGSTVAAHEGHD